MIVDTEKNQSLREYWTMIRRRWKLVSAFAVAGVGVGTLLYLTAAPAYVATSEVRIERPSGYVISASIGGIGTATTTKQQVYLMQTEQYQRRARALAEIAPTVPLNLGDQALLDDISTVMQTDVLDSRIATPVRIVLYDLPSPSLLSFQQGQTLEAAPDLYRELKDLGRIAVGPDFDLTAGWERGRPGPSDQHVRNNIRQIARAPFMDSLQSIGITNETARDAVEASAVGDMRPNLIVGARVRLAAEALDALSRLDRLAKTDKERGRNIIEMTSAPDILKAAGEIMQSTLVATMEEGPGRVDWFAMSPAERWKALKRAESAVNLYQRKHPEKENSSWKVTGKEVDEGTDIIAIRQTAPTADEAREVANAMAAITVWEDRMSKIAKEERSVRFLMTQLGTENTGATRVLREKEDALTAFRKKNQLLDVDTSTKLAIQAAADLETEKGEAEASIAEASAALRATERQLGGTQTFTIAPTIQQNPLVQSIRGSLVEAETNLAGLKAKGYTDEWPDVQRAKAEIESLQKQLGEEALTSITRQYTPDPVHFALLQKAADLAAKKVGLEARKSAVTHLLTDTNSKFANLPDKQADLVRLMRAYNIAERQYMELSGRLLDARNNKAMGQGNARVVSVAMEPGKKAAPRKKTLAIGLILGVFFGSLCAILLSSTDQYLRTPEDVRRELNVPVLAHLPAIPSTAGLVVEAMPAAPVTEAFRALRAAIRFSSGDRPIQTLVATSTKAAEGKSTVVANLAASLAQAGLTVTAVDADLRRPRLASFFGAPATNGLTDVLAGLLSSRQARQATRIPGLYLIPAGSASTSNPGELLDNGRIGKALEDVREGNDMVIVDTPPIGVVTDAALVGSAADATILILESGTVEPDDARAALARLTETARAHVLGVVLVGGDAPVSRDYVRYVSAVTNGNGNGHDSAAETGGRKSRGGAIKS